MKSWYNGNGDDNAKNDSHLDSFLPNGFVLEFLC